MGYSPWGHKESDMTLCVNSNKKLSDPAQHTGHSVASACSAEKTRKQRHLWTFSPVRHLHGLVYSSALQTRRVLGLACLQAWLSSFSICSVSYY